MPMDTGPLLEALGPPAFTHEGRTYTGRHLSILEWATHIHAVEQLQRQELGILGILQFHRQLIRVFFPSPRRPWWQLRRPSSEAARVFLELPLAIQHELMASFLNSQARALGLARKTAPPALGMTTES